MTTVAESPRELRRRELAELLHLDPVQLGDEVCLGDELGVDSVSMMRVLTWLDGHGLTDADAVPQRVGDLLNLVGQTTFGELSIRIGKATGRQSGPADIPAAPQRPSDPLAPVMRAHRLSLTLIRPEDMSFLYALAAEPETSYRWRYRGTPPSPERFAAELWSQILTQFVVRRTDDGRPVGHVVCYAADIAAGHAYLGAVFLPECTGTGQAAHAVALFVGHLFHTFPLRKIYLDIPGYNWPQMQSGQGRLFQVEGVQRDHDYYAGRHWDRYLCAIYPSWKEQ